jgi:hypothetical protein
MHRLSVCTKPRYQSYIAIDDIQLLATSLESMYELIVDGTDLSQVMKLPKEVQSLVLSYLAPFPEVVALAQTRALQLHLSRAPCDSITFSYVNSRLYLSTFTYQGREYISSVSNRKPRGYSRYRQVELSGDRILITMDNFGVRDVSSTYRKDDRGIYFSSMDTLIDFQEYRVLVGETDVCCPSATCQIADQL